MPPPYALYDGKALVGIVSSRPRVTTLRVKYVSLKTAKSLEKIKLQRTSRKSVRDVSTGADLRRYRHKPGESFLDAPGDVDTDGSPLNPSSSRHSEEGGSWYDAPGDTDTDGSPLER